MRTGVVAPGGSYPFGPLMRGRDGNFYGTEGGVAGTCGVVDDAAGNLNGAASACGSHGHHGSVFKLAPDGSETVLHRFLGWDHGEGGVPMSALVAGIGRDSDYLYGTTSLGGASKACEQGCGVIFKIKK